MYWADLVSDLFDCVFVITPCVCVIDGYEDMIDDSLFEVSYSV